MNPSNLIRDLQPIVTGWVVALLQRGAGVGVHIGSGLTDPAPGCLELDGSIRSSTALGCRACHASDQTLPNAAWTALALDRSLFDTDAMHSLTTNSSRITCRTGGAYLLCGHLLFSASSSGKRGIALRLNGSVQIARAGLFPADADDFGLSAATVCWMDAGDYIELLGYQSSGASLAVKAAARFSPDLAAVRLA